jgi:hypothetical protein
VTARRWRNLSDKFGALRAELEACEPCDRVGIAIKALDVSRACIEKNVRHELDREERQFDFGEKTNE